MSGSAVNRGGVRVEHIPPQDDGDRAFQWWARMRNHAGHGETQAAAFDDLIADIEKELDAAKSAARTFSSSDTER